MDFIYKVVDTLATFLFGDRPLRKGSDMRNSIGDTLRTAAAGITAVTAKKTIYLIKVGGDKDVTVVVRGEPSEADFDQHVEFDLTGIRKTHDGVELLGAGGKVVGTARALAKPNPKDVAAAVTEAMSVVAADSVHFPQEITDEMDGSETAKDLASMFKNETNIESAAERFGQRVRKLWDESEAGKAVSKVH